jgi:hypothetical protein
MSSEALPVNALGQLPLARVQHVARDSSTTIVTVHCPYCHKSHDHTLGKDYGTFEKRESDCAPGGEYNVHFENVGVLGKRKMSMREFVEFQHSRSDEAGTVRSYAIGERPALFWYVGSSDDVQTWADTNYPKRYIADFARCTPKAWLLHHVRNQPNYDNEEVVEIRNFKGQIDAQTMCSLLDWYPAKLNVGRRGTQRNINAKTWIISSLKGPLLWFKKDTNERFARRIKEFGCQIIIADPSNPVLEGRDGLQPQKVTGSTPEPRACL